MFLRCYPRHKDGKAHRYWSLVETQRVSGGRVVQRPVLYLGEINDSQQTAWRKTIIEVFEDGAPEPRPLGLFADDRRPAVPDDHIGTRYRSLAPLRLQPGQAVRRDKGGLGHAGLSCYIKNSRGTILIFGADGEGC
jgi:hypothetical protein